MEEVMDFEIGHLDMLDSAPSARETQSTQILNSHSLILNDLQKETEELQNKLKLNNRRLLLFETENNKLMEEKNKFFFEMQNLTERNKILIEKMQSLESENTDLGEAHSLMSEKNQSLKAINHSQLLDLKRFTKFHLKIQNVIKPYINQLKNSNNELKHNLSRSEQNVEELKQALQHAQQSRAQEVHELNSKLNSMEKDKRHTIANYEEQIHSFSKEIIRLESLSTDSMNEVSRLKKAVEFKNYFENELIKFKRIHEEDQREILSCKEKITSVSIQFDQLNETSSMAFEKLKSTETELMNKEQLLETTRSQLANTIERSDLLTERLGRLEKLNLNLSQQMQQKI